ncbi:MAG: YigZ family protein [Anaerolineaceae bacterium]|nr:YigZ family protein [Anaerolineaceae bacterium]
MTGYLIPTNACTVKYEIAKSRFIATLLYVESVDDVQRELARIRAEMSTASHHVYAFRIGYDTVTEGMSDDGEPSGTAGPPVLAILRGSKLGDTLIIVTRYFGGTKLGTGGLVRAYSEAARQALAAAKTTEKIEKTQLEMVFSYSLYERIKRLIAEHTGEIDDEQFTEQVRVTATFPTARLAEFQDDLQELTAGQVTPNILGDST